MSRADRRAKAWSFVGQGSARFEAQGRCRPGSTHHSGKRFSRSGASPYQSRLLQPGLVQATFQFLSLRCMTITVSPEDPRSPEAQVLLNAFVDEVRQRYDAAPADVGYFDPALVAGPKSAFLVARVEGRAVGCGALVPMEDDIVEIKRMFVLPNERGHGIAKKILDGLQSLAQGFDYDRIRLETGTKQPESIALYGKSGFYRVPNFPPFDNDTTAVCFEKRI
jgi:putative acetyltransferase